MNSIAFPKMFSSVKTNIVSESNHEATTQNLKLMLKSDRNALFGDPYYGTILKQMLFEQGSVKLKDIIIDEIYTSILEFIPQLSLKRNDISVTIEHENVYVKIKCLNLIDYTTNLYTIRLTDNDEI